MKSHMLNLLRGLVCAAAFPLWSVSTGIAAGFDVSGKTFDAQTPPLGLKTYSDLDLVIDESLQASVIPKTAPLKGARQQRIFPLLDIGNHLMLGVGAEVLPDGTTQRFDSPKVIWTSYSKDEGKTWSEPRFLAALVGDATPDQIEMKKGKGEGLNIFVDDNKGSRFEIKLKQYDLRRLATVDDLLNAPVSRFVIKSVSPDNKDIYLQSETLCVGRDISIDLAYPPTGYRVRKDLGLLVQDSMQGQVVHTAQSSQGTLYETRAVVTPKGDYMIFIPDGSHGNSTRPDANILTSYRSSDQGRTWQGPTFPFGEGKHLGVLPVAPKGGTRMFAYESLRDVELNGKTRDRTFGFRTSDDDGRTWSAPELVKLTDGSVFGGVGVIPIRGSETKAGTLMAGFHHARVLRGEKTEDDRAWTLATPADKPAEDAPQGIFPLDELQVVGLSGSQAMAVGRTCQGHLWDMRSDDDGRTWGTRENTGLVHPDAPPMVYRLSDGKTLIALHHNRAVMRSVYEMVHSEWATKPSPTAAEVEVRKKNPHSLNDWVSRSEIWFSLSRDGGKTWSEPRFMFANVLAETLDDPNPNYQCSYVDLFTDKGNIHLIFPHRWQRVIHLTFPEDKLDSFLTREQLAQEVDKSHKS